MIVGFDLQPLVQGASGGIVQWLGGIIRAYATRFPGDRILLFEPEDFSSDLSEYPSIEVIRAPRNKLHALEGEILSTRSADVLIRSYPDVSHPGFPMERQIAVIPDLQHAERPEFFSPEILRARRLAFGRLLSEAGAVGTMTEFSRKSILRYPWTACGDIFLMPPALDPAFAECATQNPRANFRPSPSFDGISQFFFMPANPWPHKNHRRLFEAFGRARPHLPAGTGLVLTGAGEGWAQLISGYEHLPIRHLGYLARADLADVYRRSLALAFFSLYEGFGMPLLEAFHFGTPVVCSNIPPLVDVGGNAVLSCAPDDVSAMADLMVRVATDSSMREELVARGKDRVRHFSWERSADALRDAILRVRERSEGHQRVISSARSGRRFSIIIDPALGGSVDAAVKAVVAQGHGDWELLVPASPHAKTDLTGDPRLRVIVTNDFNCAARAALALAQATGDARIYLRPDCILRPEALARIAMCFDGDPACDIVAASTIGTNPSGELVASWAMPIGLDDEPPPGQLDQRTFAFERNLMSHLGGDFRSMRPVVAWSRRIEGLGAEFDRNARFMFDGDYWLRLLEAGGNLSVIDEPVAEIRLADDFASARLWYKVMRDYVALARRRRLRLDPAFFLLLSHRQFGSDPSLSGAWRGLPAVLGWCRYRMYRGRPKLLAGIDRARNRLLGRNKSS